MPSNDQNNVLVVSRRNSAGKKASAVQLKKPCSTPHSIQASNQMRRAKEQLRKIQAMEHGGGSGVIPSEKGNLHV